MSSVAVIKITETETRSFNRCTDAEVEKYKAAGPGFWKMACLDSEKSVKTFNMVFDYSWTPGDDAWSTNVSGIMPVTNGKWSRELFAGIVVKDADGAEICWLGSASELCVLWNDWPDIPFKKGLKGAGTRRGSNRNGTLNVDFAWECTGVG